MDKKYLVKKIVPKVALLFVCLVSLFMLVQCGEPSVEKPPVVTSTPTPTATPTATPTPTPSPEPTPIPDKVVSMLTAGDNLIHSSLYVQANRRANNNGYDFAYAYENIEDMIAGYDISILNQETIVTDNKYAPSSYPCFNSPKELGDHMVDIGFNAFSLSNNHILDKREEGLSATLDYWDTKEDILTYGAYRNEEDVQNIKTKEINGIKFAFIGITEHTNGIPLRDGYDVEVIYADELERIKGLIAKADKMADLVVLSVHWGYENTNVVNDNQKYLANMYVSYGADLIIGTHPHVVQNMEYKEKPDGGQAFVIYSLGNFISAQDKPNNLLGQVVSLNIVQNGETGVVTFEEVKAMPIVTHYGTGYSNITVYPFADYTDELASKHGLKANGYKFDREYMEGVLDKYISAEYLVKDKIW